MVPCESLCKPTGGKLTHSFTTAVVEIGYELMDIAFAIINISKYLYSYSYIGDKTAES